MSNKATAKIDQNDTKSWLAYNETTSAPEAVRCDSVLDYTEIYVIGNASGTYTAINNAKIDQNHAKTKLLYNDTTGQIECARCDTDGNLLVQLN